MDNLNEFDGELAAELTEENQLAPAADPLLEDLKEEEIQAILEKEENIY